MHEDKDLVGKSLAKLSLKGKMRFGFGIFSVVLIIVTIQAVINLYIVREDIKEVIEVKQPVSLEAGQMVSSLKNSIIYLSSYMLTAEPTYMLNYQNEHSKSISILKLIKPKLNAQQLVEHAKLTKYFNKLPTLINKVVKYTTNSHQKFPAFKFVAENMEAKAKTIKQQLVFMTDSELEELSAERKEIVSLLFNLQEAWVAVMSNLRGYVAFRTEAMAGETGKGLKSVIAILDKMSNLPIELSFEEEEGIEIIKNMVKQYQHNFVQLKAIHQGPKWRMDTWVIKNELSPLFEKINKSVVAIGDISTQDMVTTSEKLIESSMFNLKLLISISILGSIIGFFIARKVTSSLIMPVDRIVIAMKDIAEGEGDLTRRLQVNGTDELAVLSGYFNNFIGKIQKTISEVTKTVDSLESSSKSLKETTHITKEGIDNQVVISEQLSSSMQAMAKNSKAIEDHSKNTSSATEQALNRVKESGEVVGSASKTIQQVSDGMDEINKSVIKLNKDSQTIRSVTEVIKEIANQTNMLALNAAVEAARAGEHGRGFAVVADEVRGLAKRTQESTQLIDDAISQISHATDETIKVVKKGQATTKIGYDSVMKANQVLSPVVILMDDINNMNNEMFASSQSQNVLVKDVNKRINKIHEISTKSVGYSENNENSSDSIQIDADKLEKLVHQFKI